MREHHKPRWMIITQSLGLKSMIMQPIYMEFQQIRALAWNQANFSNSLYG